MTQRTLTILSSVLFTSLFSLTLGYAQNSILGNNIFSPILVTGDGVNASGTYWAHGGNIYLLTAKHVILKDSTTFTSSQMTLKSYSSSGSGAQQCVLDIDLNQALKSRELRAHKTHDIALVRIGHDTVISGSHLIEFLRHVTPKAIATTGIMTASAVTLFESAIVSNDAFALGYPAAIGIPHIPQLDYSQPLLRRGIVAGKNYINRTLIIDSPSYPGNSGGPVFEVDETDDGRTMRLIGVVSQFIPFQEIWYNRPFGYQNQQISNSGYTVVVPMDFAFDLIR